MEQLTIKDLFNELVAAKIQLKEKDLKIDKLKQEYKDSNEAFKESLKEAHGVSSKERRKYFDCNKELEEAKNNLKKLGKCLRRVWVDYLVKIKHDWKSSMEITLDPHDPDALSRFDLVYVTKNGNVAVYRNMLSHEYQIESLDKSWFIKEDKTCKDWQVVRNFILEGFINAEYEIELYKKLKEKGFDV